MEKTVRFLKEAGTYFLATVEDGQPHVRPFGTANVFEGKLYVETERNKRVARQIMKNPLVELCAFKDGTWLRLAGELVEDDRVEAKKSMLDAYPELREMNYDENDGNTMVFYFKNATATFSSFTAPTETETF